MKTSLQYNPLIHVFFDFDLPFGEKRFASSRHPLPRVYFTL